MSAKSLKRAAPDDPPPGGPRAINSRPDAAQRASLRLLPCPPPRDSRHRSHPHVIDPADLSDHIDPLYRAARALCRSQHDAEDLVQETFAQVLKRPRTIREGNELAYLMRALRNIYASRYRIAKRRPDVRQLSEDDATAHDGGVSARGLMEAIASAPARYRDAVIAVDLLGLSYREAARSLHNSRRRSRRASTADGSTSHAD